MKTLIIVLAGCLSFTYSQFSIKDSSLLKSLFFRTSDSATISKYLRSSNPETITAGLLAAGNMPDSVYIPLILSLPFEQYSAPVSFALSKHSPVEEISEYLRKVILSEAADDVRASAVETYGMVGSTEDYQFLIELHLKNDNVPAISTALYHFRLRKFEEHPGHQNILLQELQSNNERRIREAAFALSRGGKYDGVLPQLKNIISGADSKEFEELTKYYLLSLIKRLPDKQDLLPYISTALQSDSPVLQIEALTCLGGFKFSGTSPFSEMLESGSYKNPNVLIKLVQQIRLNSYDFPAREKIKLSLIRYLEQFQSPSYISEQTLYALAELDKSEAALLTSKYSNLLSRSGYYTLLRLSGISDSVIVGRVIPEFAGLSLTDRLKVLTMLFNQESLQTLVHNQQFRQYIHMNIKSNEPALISVIAENLSQKLYASDSAYFYDELTAILKRELHNPHFTEAVLTIYTQLVKYAPSKTEELKSILANSSIVAVAAAGGKQISSNSKVRAELAADLLKEAFTSKFAKVKTNAGEFTLRFFPEYAPFSVGNFIKLAKEGFFNGIIFHRVVPGFVIQAGDRTGTGYDGPGYDIISEFSWLNYNPYTLGMASAGKDTEGSQWFVTSNEFPHLNRRYTIFGEVTEGFDAVQTISQEIYIREIVIF